MEAILGRRIPSASVRPNGPRARLSRVKRTSLEVCRREDVVVKMFSGAKEGRVEMRARRAEMKMMLRDLDTELGTRWIGTGAVAALTFWVRYQDMSLGIRRGPRVKRMVLRLLEVSRGKIDRRHEGSGLIRT